MATVLRDQTQLPIQPVNNPILCSPYQEPDKHWVYDIQTGEASQAPGRRPASYWYRSQRTGSAQMGLFAEEERDDLPLVNAVRADVRRWREAGYPNAENVTKQLLAHWNRQDRTRRLFFCQVEAVETIIYLNEILRSGKRLPWQKLELSREDFERLSAGEKPLGIGDPQATVFPTLADQPAAPWMPPLTRYGCKMATGSGKTVVMSMLIAWTLCNRGRKPNDERFPAAVLVVCPNLTVKERLQVLRPERDDNYYEAFDLVPTSLIPEMKKGKVLLENWHQFAPESPHAEGGKTYAVVNKGEESAQAFARRVLGDLYDRGPLMVLNDEAHHAYRPAPIPDDAPLTAEERAEREEATVWIDGLDRINQGLGIRLCVDLSATPFYLQGSGYIEGSPFPWLVSDFGLVDAIESGIVKIPRLPVSDTTGRPEPKYFALWKHITENLQPGERLPGRGRKPKPEVVWREAEDALRTLTSQWKERWEYIQGAKPEQEHTPPVLIIVCDNTDIAELFYRNISGEQVEEVVNAEDLDETDDTEEETEAPRGRGKGKPKSKVVYGQGKLIPEFQNAPGRQYTLRIDTKLLSEAESADGSGSRKDAAERLREIVATVGKRGAPGEHIRCVVSVQMLSEGWDANNVTHIFGLRAFGSQLLCEQVVGRGLRRMDYTPDPETGLLTEEYVDVYGVPFSVIPFKGRDTQKPAPEDKPKNHVRSLDERKHFEIHFPVVEGYALALEKNLIRADISKIEPLTLDAGETPTAVFVKPQVGYQLGGPSLAGGFAVVEQTREEYYRTTHLQTITFEIARQVSSRLSDANAAGNGKKRYLGRHQLFPQVYRIVDEYVCTRIHTRGCDRRELGLEKYATLAVERLSDAIRPNDEQGEPPLLPILNRYKPIGSTAGVDFKTTRPVFATIRSHINAVAADTATWEQSAAFRLEQAAVSGLVECYARNDHLEFGIPYEFLGISHTYLPDYLVKLVNGTTLVLEVKGWEDEQDKAKHEAARRWVDAVNHWRQLGRWAFHVCKDPQMLGREVEYLLTRKRNV
jgi:type III restriction enzyme